MIDGLKLKEKYNLTIEEYKAICNRVHELEEMEKRGLVISRCNGTLKSTKK